MVKSNIWARMNISILFALLKICSQGPNIFTQVLFPKNENGIGSTGKKYDRDIVQSFTEGNQY